MAVRRSATLGGAIVQRADDGLGAVRRALAVLKYLAQRSPLGSRLSDIAAATGLPPSTAHRLLRGLAAEGMVLRETGAGRLYKLGPFALGLGPEASRHHFSWFAAICRPSLERLAAATGHAAQLTIRVGRSGLSLDLVAGSGPAHPAFAKSGAVGFMGFGSASVALLAALPEALVEEILWENDWLLGQAAIAPERLKQMIGEARRDGYCYSERVFVPDLCALSLCVPSRSGLAYAALTILAQTDRIAPERVDVILSHLKREASVIARQADHMAAPA
ncbi:MAG TPA: helix-turn-helix domain-containing protein [Alphaproteobacteria bacterium]|nr:helix-turn-helix domain-containing protein [Alphaproteobacteria bacterium]